MVELSIVEQNEITIFLHHYFNLCMILARDYGFKWFMEQFVTVSTLENEYSANLKLEFLVNYQSIMDESGLEYQAVSGKGNLIEFVTGNINEGRYPVLHFDEYYLPGKDVYQKWHFVHKSLIYGYNPQNKTILGLGFTKNQILKKFSMDYDLMELSYEMGKQYFREGAPWLEKYIEDAIRVYTFKFTDYHINLKFLINSFKAYLTPTILPMNQFLELISGKQISKFGIDIYDDILTNLQNTSKIVDYRTFHFIYEHKKAIYKRLEFINRNFPHILKHDISEQIHAYAAVMLQANTLKNIYMKQALLESSFKNLYIPIREKRIIDTLIKRIETLKSEEREILLDTGITEIR